jgi:DNA-binding Xre family transcriptional regulator
MVNRAKRGKEAVKDKFAVKQALAASDSYREIREAIGTVLRQRCEEIGVSLHDVAKQTGLSVPTLSRMVNNPDYQIILSNLCAVCDALGLSIYELFNKASK